MSESPIQADSASTPSSSPTQTSRTTGGRARKRAETRERLFEAALRDFREYGFTGSQIDRIAKSAGVVRGTFYFHFPTKDDVLIELSRRISDRAARRLIVMGDGSSSLRELLMRVNDVVGDEHTRLGEAGLEADMLALYLRRPHDMNLPAELNAPTLAGELERHLDVIKERGGFDSVMSNELIAIVFMTSLFGIYVRIPPGENRRIACEALVDLFATGLQVSPPSEGAQVWRNEGS